MRKIHTVREYEPPHEPRKFLDHQTRAWMSRGVLKATGVSAKSFYPQLSALTPIAMGILAGYKWEEGRIPCLLVNHYIPLWEQLQLAVFSRREVQLSFREEKLVNDWGEGEILSPWYLAVDVELREDLRDISVREAERRFAEEGRLGLNVYEGIALNIHRPRRGITVSLPGSRVGYTHVPNITISDERIVLHANRPGLHFPNWIAASCAKRIGVPRT